MCKRFAGGPRKQDEPSPAGLNELHRHREAYGRSATGRLKVVLQD
jgi:hypothetical protein